MAAITAKAKLERRHALRSPTLYGLMASGQRLDQGSAQWKREMVSAMTGPRWDRPFNASRQSIVAVLPIVMLPTWSGMVMLSATAEEDARAEVA